MSDLFSPRDWSQLSVEELEQAVARHNHAYWIDQQPLISDPEFDRLVEALRAAAPDSPILQAIGPAGAIIADDDGDEGGDGAQAIDAASDKVAHDPPMLSLDKCYDEETLLRWFDKFDGEVVVTPKIDGVAASIAYDADGQLLRAATRGTGTHGELMTDHARAIVDLPERIAEGPLEVRGEAYMPLSVFRADFAEDYSSPRNLTAGALKLKDAERTRAYRIHFFAYDLLGRDFDTEAEKMAYLRALGFSTVDTEVVALSALQDAYDAIAARRDEFDYETDGVVYKVDRVDEQRRLGHTAHHPRYAIAYKFQGESGQSVLREVHWSVSRTGAINPVGVVDPVSLSGAMVSRCSLHNLAIMAELGGEAELTLGSRVLMVRRGGVIPHLERVLEAGEVPVTIPRLCPFCEAETYRQNDVLVADHNEGCRGSRLKELEHFASVLEIKGFGPKLLEQLFEAELVTEPSDFFTLRVEDLLALDRMGETLARKLVGRIEERREVAVETFLRALGIPELGNHVASILGREYDDLDAIRAAEVEELAAIHTIGEIIARRVTEGLARHAERIDSLLGHLEVRFPEPAAEAATHDSPIAGRKFLFTGAMEAMSRGEAKKRVKAAGGETPSGVVRDLDFLVIGDADLARFETGWRTKKLSKAEDYNASGSQIRIIGESDFLALLAEA